HRLSGRLNFPRRIATAYWNAAVWTLHNRFADAVEASLKDMGINAPAYLLKADGGAIPLSVSRDRPVEALLSGPAASVMGMMALMPSCSEDTLVLDMGGTTTDIALLAAGQPVLSPDDLVVNGRSTLVRSLKSVSIGLGGDSQVTATSGVQVGPLRKGPALAFGGTDGPTFLDCLNVLGHAEAGDTGASRTGVESLAAAHGLTAESLSRQVLECARSRVAAAVRSLLDEVNSQPVYTLAALLEERAVRPVRAVLVGGPAEAVAPLLGEALGLPVETLGDPVLGPVANAIGAALTRPTASLDLFADTAAGVLLVPSLDIRKPITRRYTLEEAKAEACALLRGQVENAFAPASPEIDVTEAQVFATLDEYGRGGRDIRVRCQLRPGVER
ncbi:hydantoinase/oxoprolinase family protein, partial [uncultured Bilophila sp.]|uniref:hydantoinase/oxoprolinase family protein n=1 Tax=uncultured Bilophila sp. TaxID=529385 RepID=UPI00280B1227